MVRKKHNPIKRYHAIAKAKLKNKIVTFLVNGTPYAELRTKEGKLLNITQDTVDILEKVPHRWSVVCVVLCKSEIGDIYLQTQMLPTTSKYYKRDLTELCNATHQRLVKEANSNHLVTAGWVASPEPREFSDEYLLALFEHLGAWKYLAKWETTIKNQSRT